jgi:orotidine-5'-phosphate decarboxylase
MQSVLRTVQKMSKAKMNTSPVILALDTPEIDIAQRWISATNEVIKTYKAGLEFFLKHGAEGISRLREAGDFDLFLDLKLHDIPNTVASAAKSVSHINPRFLTVHASGGSDMVKAASQALEHVDITAVTILTSLSEEALLEIGFAKSALESAVQLAKISVAAGAKAIVCSPLEVESIRDAIGPTPTIITPGVRPAGSALGDQARVMTPADAIAAGSTYLVIGRPITSLENSQLMLEKAKEISDSITQ